MSDVKLRSFTVPIGKPWVVVPPDGDGPFIAHPGDQVVLVCRQTWDEALKAALAELTMVPK